MAKTCFILMGFGEKTDYRTQRTLDLDKTCKIIRQAVETCGLQCIRADDIIHSGAIDRPMYEQLLRADIVIADLSTANENAIYALGVRHALRPHTSLLIAERQFKFPFDLNHLLIRPYTHLGSGIDFEEAERLKDELMQAINTLLDKAETDSPVYTFLPDLTPPQPTEQPITITADDTMDQETFSELLDAFHAARAEEEFGTAKALVDRLRKLQPDDPYLMQQQALVTYKSQEPDPVTALHQAKQILQDKQPPLKSNDPETLGLWGVIHKRLWELEQDPKALNTAITAYKRAFYLRQDSHTGISYAFLLDARAPLRTDAVEALTDRVIAKRIRRKVLNELDAAEKNLPRDAQGQPADLREAYRLGAARLEALLGLGMLQELETESAALFASAPEPGMVATTRHRLDRLMILLNPTVTDTVEQALESALNRS